MPYLERMLELVYRSPSGIEHRPFFDSLERSSGKKAAITELPQQDLPDVQDLGNSALLLPLTLYFSGPDYDVAADSFWTSLEEPGFGTLVHPRWGTIPVFPTARKQSEGFVQGARAAIFTVEFVRVNEKEEYPLTAAGQASGVANAVADASIDAADDFAADFSPSDIRDKLRISEQIKSAVSVVTDTLSGVASFADDVSEQLQSVAREITATADELIGAPALLAASVIRLIRTPARIETGIREKIRGYKLLYKTLAKNFTPETGAFTVTGSVAQSQTSALFLTAVGLATAEAVVTDDGETQNREQVAVSASEILEIRDGIFEIILALEEQYPGFFYPPEIAQTLREQMTTASDLLFELGFSLRMERMETLDRDTTPLDYVYRVYGDIDRLGEWIAQNELTGNEFFVIRTGREVRYYE